LACVGLQTLEAINWGSSYARWAKDSKKLEDEKRDLSNKCLNPYLSGDQLQKMLDRIKEIDQEQLNLTGQFGKDLALGMYGEGMVIWAFCGLAVVGLI
jgi:hypothetical protein